MEVIAKVDRLTIHYGKRLAVDGLSFELARGGRGVNLQGRFDTALKVVRAADGSFRLTCGDPAHGGEPHSHSPADTESVTPPTASNRAPVQ